MTPLTCDDLCCSDFFPFSYLFSIWCSAADARSGLLVISWQVVEADGGEKRFEHADVKPHRFVWTLPDVKIKTLLYFHFGQKETNKQTITRSGNMSHLICVGVEICSLVSCSGLFVCQRKKRKEKEDLI